MDPDPFLAARRAAGTEPGVEPQVHGHKPKRNGDQ